jgi:hypothetical protein
MHSDNETVEILERKYPDLIRDIVNLVNLHRKIAVEEYLSRSVAMLDHLRQQQNVLRREPRRPILPVAGSSISSEARCFGSQV